MDFEYVNYVNAVHVALRIIPCSSWPCAPNLTASLEIQICRCIGNTRTVVEALGLAIHKGQVLTFIELESILRKGRVEIILTEIFRPPALRNLLRHTSLFCIIIIIIFITVNCKDVTFSRKYVLFSGLLQVSFLVKLCQ